MKIKMKMSKKKINLELKLKSIEKTLASMIFYLFLRLPIIKGESKFTCARELPY